MALLSIELLLVLSPQGSFIGIGATLTSGEVIMGLNNWSKC